MRIAKFLSHAGVCSRRDAEKLIAEGRVSLNGKKLDSPAIKVDESDKITVNGKPVQPPERLRVFLHHKKAGLVTTHKDEANRTTLFETLSDDLPRLISVGRLDMNTEGLIILTTDGDLSRHLELPSTGWRRRYKARAYGKVTQSDLNRLQNGIMIDGIKYGAIEAELISTPQGSNPSKKIQQKKQNKEEPSKSSSTRKANCWITLSLSEGKNREVRKVLEHLGLQVNRLIRLSYGPFQLGNLKAGETKELTPKILKDQLPQQFRDKI